MSPLPSLSSVDFDAEGLGVWPLLKNAEKEAHITSTGLSAKYHDDLIGVRVLGFFLKDFWDHQDCQHFGLTPYKLLILELNSCNRVENVAVGSAEESQAQNAKVFKLGLDLRNHLMRVYRSSAGPSSTPSRHASPPSWDKARNEMMAAMAKAPTTKHDAEKQALYRDGYKCMISGSYDTKSYFKYPELKRQAKAEGQVNAITDTQVAHLFSESARDRSSEYAACAFTMLKMFEIGPTKLLGGQVNDLSNVLTMTSTLHRMFDEFDFWLEKVPFPPNTYDVCSHIEDFFSISEHPPRRVTFQVDPAVEAAWNANPPRDEENNLIPLPSLPNPRLIAIRAACARVAHMSGATEQADQILEDREDTEVMADDGSTANLLHSLLLRTSSTIDVGA